MRKIFKYFISLIFIITSMIACDSKKELTSWEISNSMQNKIVKVLCYDIYGNEVLSQGTGFYINSNGTFITNAHVVEKAYLVKIRGNGFFLPAKRILKYNDSNSDYAIFQTNQTNTSYVKFSSNYNKNDEVYSLGYPDDASSLVMQSGKIINCEVVDENITYIENTAKIDFGSSGGVLCNKYGEVIGITTGLLSSNNYGAIRYTDFKSEVSSNQNINKTPLEYFHNARQINFTTLNIETYFNLSYTDETNEKLPYSQCFNLYCKIKNNYLNKLAPDHANQTVVPVYISIDVKTKFKYKDNYGKIQTYDSTSYIYFNIYPYSFTDQYKKFVSNKLFNNNYTVLEATTSFNISSVSGSALLI